VVDDSSGICFDSANCDVLRRSSSRKKGLGALCNQLVKLLVGGKLVDAAARNIVSGEKFLHWVAALIVGRTTNATLSEP